MTRFSAGDRVVSNVDAQGLKSGGEYVVRDVDAQPTPFGTFVVYVLRGTDGRERAIHNGHLLLDRVF